MNIEDFDPAGLIEGQDSPPKVYNCPALGMDFAVKCTPAPFITKIEPPTKDQIKRYIGAAIDRLKAAGRWNNPMFTGTDHFYDSTDYHQLYLLDTKTPKGMLAVHFHDRPESDGENDLLDCLQETSILWRYTDTSPLDAGIAEMFGRDIPGEIAGDPVVLARASTEFAGRISKDYAPAMLKVQASAVLHLLQMMTGRGYAQDDVFRYAESMRVSPVWPSRSDYVRNEVKRRLKVGASLKT